MFNQWYVSVYGRNTFQILSCFHQCTHSFAIRACSCFSQPERYLCNSRKHGQQGQASRPTIDLGIYFSGYWCLVISGLDLYMYGYLPKANAVQIPQRGVLEMLPVPTPAGIVIMHVLQYRVSTWQQYFRSDHIHPGSLNHYTGN